MTQRNFYIQLGLVSVGLILLLLVLHQLASLQGFLGFSLIMVAFFIVFSIIMYFVGTRAVNGENKYAFINAVIGFIMGKLFFCAIIIFIYTQLVQPSSNNFLFPFMLIYITYTIFEVYFLSKVSNAKK